MISAAAFELLASNGVDGLALTKVAAAAGLSTGPLYNRYDSGEDIALELWEESIRDHGARMIGDLATYLFSPEGELSEFLDEELLEFSSATIAYSEMMAVARRFPLLIDPLRDELERQIGILADSAPNLPMSIAAVPISLLLGLPAVRDVHPPCRIRWRDVLAIAKSIIAERETWDLPARASQIPTYEPVRPRTGDETLDVFVAAVMDVVSKVGYERTSAHRVARSAGRSFSSAYSHIGSKHELMIYALTATIEQTMTVGGADYLVESRDGYIDRMSSMWNLLVTDQARSVRHLRIETVLAANHHPDLREAMRSKIARDLAELPIRLGRDLDDDKIDRANTLWCMIRALGTGQIVIINTTPILNDINWTSYSAAGRRLVELLFLEHLT